MPSLELLLLSVVGMCVCTSPPIRSASVKAAAASGWIQWFHRPRIVNSTLHPCRQSNAVMHGRPTVPAIVCVPSPARIHQHTRTRAWVNARLKHLVNFKWAIEETYPGTLFALWYRWGAYNKVQLVTGRPLNHNHACFLAGPFQLHIGQLHNKETHLLVLEHSTTDVILGCLWLVQHNPDISWKIDKVWKWGRGLLLWMFPSSSTTPLSYFSFPTSELQLHREPSGTTVCWCSSLLCTPLWCISPSKKPPHQPWIWFWVSQCPEGRFTHFLSQAEGHGGVH